MFKWPFFGVFRAANTQLICGKSGLKAALKDVKSHDFEPVLGQRLFASNLPPIGSRYGLTYSMLCFMYYFSYLVGNHIPMTEKNKSFAGCFIKFGKKEHLKELREKGLLYCNPIQYFTSIEDQSLRGDEMENVVDMHYMESGTVTLSPVGEKPSANSTTMPFRDARFTSRIVEPFGNLFCLFSINLLDKPFGEVFTISERVKEFGDSFLLIHDSSAFFNRVQRAAATHQLRADADLVEYKDFSRFTGKKTVFQKDLRYAYQQEWRLYIHNNKAELIKLEIGSLEDISVWGTSKSIEQLLIAGRQVDETRYSILSNMINEP